MHWKDVCREKNGSDVCDSADACLNCQAEAARRKLDLKGGFRVPPVDSLFTTRHIENGHGGNKPLPVVDLPNDMELTAWVLPRKALKAWMRSPHVLQLVKAPDGSLSLSVVPVKTVKSN